MQTLKDWFTNKRVKDLEAEVKKLRDMVGVRSDRMRSVWDSIVFHAFLGDERKTETPKDPTLLERIEGIEKHLKIEFEAKTEEKRGYVPRKEFVDITKKKRGRPKGSKNKR